MAQHRIRFNSLSAFTALMAAAAFLLPASAFGQQNPPRIGYLYPAGGCAGTTVKVTIGGQYLEGATKVALTGGGAEIKVLDTDRPLTQREINDLREKIDEVRKKVQETRKVPGGDPFARMAEIREELEMAGITPEELQKLEEFRRQRNDPKRQLNPQLAEVAVVEIKLAADAAIGVRELRLETPLGLSNPLRFHVGKFVERLEEEPNDKLPQVGLGETLPMVINGQIMPGDVDRFSVQLKKGTKLVAAVAARQLMPYLADAVPGWFQATLSLRDESGEEVAYDDDFRYQPDPVLYYVIPRDGRYVLEIKDAVYRGREDFVYRITLGELPTVTGVFPLGGPEGERTFVDLTGWNLPSTLERMPVDAPRPGVRQVRLKGLSDYVQEIPFAADTLPEIAKPAGASAPLEIRLPVVVNGRIETPAERDSFRFSGHKGDAVVAEVLARRLGSPLDSLLSLSDSTGKRIAANDDYNDIGDGLSTHHADSRISVTLPADGTYTLELTDAEQNGGPAFAYRMRVSAPRPDFDLRVTPSTINARPGGTVPITVYALRKDDFAGPIDLQLRKPPTGFSLSGTRIPAGQDKLRLTLTAPFVPKEEPFELKLEGRAVVDGLEITREATPAEDMMQAFFYRHLVPSEDLLVAVSTKNRMRAPQMKLLGAVPLKLSPGAKAEVRVAMPRGPFLDNLDLELSDPPEGVSIDGFEPRSDGVAVKFHTDAAALKPGLEGNLIVEVLAKPRANAKTKAPQMARKFSIGYLPAIPFQVSAANVADAQASH